MMTLRPLALAAWSLSYLLLFSVWAVVFTTCGAGGATRWGWSLMLVAVSLAVAAGAALTEVDDHKGAVRDGLVTWGVALGGLITLVVVSGAIYLLLLPVSLLLIVLAYLLGARVRLAPVVGAGHGAAIAVGTILAGATVAFALAPLAQSLFGNSFSSADVSAELHQASFLLMGAALPTGIGMAAVHTLPGWSPGPTAAVLRGVMVAAAMTLVVIRFGVTACGDYP